MELGLYQHYKGKFYQVVEIARDSETLEEMVVYQALYGEFSIWVRSKKMFEETVTLPDGTQKPRFAFIHNNEADDELEMELLTILETEAQAKKIGQLLHDNDIEHEIVEEKLNPKPAHLNTDTFYKIFVDEDYFEDAMELLEA